jgi:hypothetical protein
VFEASFAASGLVAINTSRNTTTIRKDLNHLEELKSSDQVLLKNMQSVYWPDWGLNPGLLDIYQVLYLLSYLAMGFM